MPFARQTLAELRTQAQADFSAALPGSDPLLRFSVVGVIADVVAEAQNGAYGYIDYVSKQSNPFTATDEAAEAWGGLKGVFKKPATQASGAAISGTSGIGLVVLAGTGFTRADGAAYVSLADVTVGGGGTATVALRAVEDGSASNLTDGQSLVLASPIAGVSSVWTVTDATAGADVESEDAYKTRYLGVYADPPQGGSRADYVEWSLNVPGVTRAWVRPNGMGGGTVIVYTMFDLAEAIHNGFPQGSGGVAAAETRDTPATQDLLLVANAIFPLQPVTALVYAEAPQANHVSLTIALAGASTATKALVQAALAQTLLTFGTPGGVSVPDGETAGVVQLSDIEAAIAAVPDAEGFVITVVACDHGTVTPGTNGNIASNTGYLPVAAAITWL